MKKLLVLLFAFFIVPGVNAQEVDVELKNIRYKEDCGCSESNPVSVKVCFRTDYKEKKDLQAVVRYSGNCTYTSPVKEFDSMGNIYYSFCSKQGCITNFEIYFRSPSGAKSSTFIVSAVPESGD